jgi:hypothetical protein
MKTKTINKVICQKFDEWLASITDEDVRKKVEKGSILTGGAIASMLLQESINDYDFYFKDFETTKAVAEYYVKQFLEKLPPAFSSGAPVEISVVVGKINRMPLDRAQEIVNEEGDDTIPPLTTDDISRKPEDESKRIRIWIRSAGIAGEQKEEGAKPYEYFEMRPPADANDFVEEQMAAKVKDREEGTEIKPDYRPIFLTDNAITLSGNIQMVIRFYGTPDQIHENYDYVHATNYWTSWERKVTLKTEALECLLTRELRYIGSKYPICSLIRARKFIQRDWSINAGQYLKIAMQINQLNLNDYGVLREQLVGMDMAYFSQVLSALYEKDPTKVNATYLGEVIDRIFG